MSCVCTVFDDMLLVVADRCGAHVSCIIDVEGYRGQQCFVASIGSRTSPSAVATKTKVLDYFAVSEKPSGADLISRL